MTNATIKHLFCVSLFLAALIFMFSSCGEKSDVVAYQKRYLNSNFGCLNNEWQFKYNGKWYSAKVPGNIHDDLLSNQLIEDPFFGNNESSVQWVSDSVWEYRLFFDKHCAEGIEYDNNDLVFEGLDTYAEVFVNGMKLTSKSGDSLAFNMFRKWVFQLPENLKEKNNELLVRFYPSGLYDSIAASSLPYQLPDNRVFTRKAQYESGWDWGPKLNTCGIWKDVYIESWNGLKINSFSVSDKEPSVDASRPWITMASIDIVADEVVSCNLKIDVTDDNGYNQSVKQKVNLRAGMNTVKIPVTIENPKLWWPNGAGEAHLYYYTVSVLDSRSDELCTQVRTHGLRTVRLEQKSDSIGESFQFYVNEKPVFMRGVNWIPASSYPGTLARSEGDDIYSELLQKCKDANMNMIRVWGGGIYEHESFYDYCDRLGLLVWQDFMFACNIYPGDKKFCDNVMAEAEEQVSRLRDHACIAVFCGNNEVHNGLEDWGWQKQFGYTDQQYASIYADYDRLFNKILPAVCHKQMPSVSYVHSSPTYGWGHEECTTHGCSHYWGVWWGELPFEVWKQKTGRFMTEYGFQSYPQMSSINQFTMPADRNLTSDAMKNHQKHARGVQIISKAMEDLFGEDNSARIEDFVYLSQLTQMEGISQAIEAHRIQHDRCSGTLVWQLNDCWPVASWSCIDYYGRPKALYYRIAGLYKNLIIASEKDESGNIVFYIVNDEFSEVKGNFCWKIAKNSDGAVVDSGKSDVAVASGSSGLVTICKLPHGANASDVHVVAEFSPTGSNDTVRYLTFFVKPKHLTKYRDNISSKTEYYDHFAVLTVKSKSLKRGVFIEETEGRDVRFSDNYFDLEPGTEVKIRIDYPNFDGKPVFRVRAY